MCQLLFAVLALAAVGTTFAVPLTQDKNTWNELLLAENIFPQEKNFIEVFSSASSDAHVLTQLTDLLGQDKFLFQLYQNYAEKFGREDILKGDVSRIEIFKNTLVAIGKHNLEARKGVHTWVKGVTPFTDLSHEEFKAKFANDQDPIESFGNSTSSRKLKTLPVTNLPDAVNWHAKKKTTPARSQGACNSCTCFVGAALLETTYAIEHNTDPVVLSPQEIIDCPGKPDVCGTGFYPGDVLDYLKETGLSTEADYPYTKPPKQHTSCANKPTQQIVKSWEELAHDEQVMKAAMVKRPVWGRVDPSKDVQHYKGGVFNGFCENKTGHSTAIMGYDTKNGVECWVIKNSWSENWGEKGYWYLPIGSNKCGITNGPFVMYT